VTRPVVNPGTVIWAGDHLLLYLKSPGVEGETTLVSFYRTVYSPLGAGHTALVLIDRDAGGWDEGDLRVIYTDNEALTAWVRENVVRLPGHPLRDYSLPIRAAQFEASGAVGQERREVIRAADHEIALTWADFEPPLYVEGPAGTFGDEFDIFSLLCPARTGIVEIDGQRAAGEPFPREIWRRATGRALSSVLIAMGEVMIARGD
jgi:hypothetical protein